MPIFTVGNTPSLDVQVYCNGQKIERAYWANTGKGIVRTYTQRMDKWKKRVIEKTYRGRVEVLMPDGTPAVPLFDARCRCRSRTQAMSELYAGSTIVAQAHQAER